MPRAVQLLGRGHPSRPGADHGDFLSRPNGGRLRLGPAFREASVGDGLLDLLDRHRVVIDPEHAGRFAGRRTDPSGKFRKIVGRVQNLQGFLPAVFIDQVVPVRNDVIERAAGVAKGDAAVHAPRALRAQFRLRHLLIDFAVVLDPLGNRSVAGRLARIFEEPGDFTHAMFRAEDRTIRAARVSKRGLVVGAERTPRSLTVAALFTLAPFPAWQLALAAPACTRAGRL